MKKITLIVFFGILSFYSNAGNKISSFANVTTDGNLPAAAYKKVNITVVVNGYTINIVGTVTYNIMSGEVTINVIIHISGNGVNLNLPFNYSGMLNKGTGNNSYTYDDSKVEEEDKQAVAVIVSHIFLPQDNDPKKIKVE